MPVRPGEKIMSLPFEIHGTDFIQLIVGNAKQAAHFYQTQFGFEPFAVKVNS